MQNIEVGMPKGVCVEKCAANPAVGAEVVAHNGFDVFRISEPVDFESVASIDNKAFTDAFQLV